MGATTSKHHPDVATRPTQPQPQPHRALAASPFARPLPANCLETILSFAIVHERVRFLRTSRSCAALVRRSSVWSSLTADLTSSRAASFHQLPNWIRAAIGGITLRDDDIDLGSVPALELFTHSPHLTRVGFVSVLSPPVPSRRGSQSHGLLSAVAPDSAEAAAEQRLRAVMQRLRLDHLAVRGSVQAFLAVVLFDSPVEPGFDLADVSTHPVAWSWRDTLVTLDLRLAGHDNGLAATACLASLSSVPGGGGWSALRDLRLELMAPPEATIGEENIDTWRRLLVQVTKVHRFHLLLDTDAADRSAADAASDSVAALISVVRDAVQTQMTAIEEVTANIFGQAVFTHPSEYPLSTTALCLSASASLPVGSFCPALSRLSNLRRLRLTDVRAADLTVADVFDAISYTHLPHLSSLAWNCDAQRIDSVSFRAADAVRVRTIMAAMIALTDLECTFPSDDEVESASDAFFWFESMHLFPCVRQLRFGPSAPPAAATLPAATVAPAAPATPRIFLASIASSPVLEEIITNESSRDLADLTTLASFWSDRYRRASAVFESAPAAAAAAAASSSAPGSPLAAASAHAPLVPPPAPLRRLHFSLRVAPRSDIDAAAAADRATQLCRRLAALPQLTDITVHLLPLAPRTVTTFAVADDPTRSESVLHALLLGVGLLPHLHHLALLGVGGVAHGWTIDAMDRCCVRDHFLQLRTLTVDVSPAPDGLLSRLVSRATVAAPLRLPRLHTIESRGLTREQHAALAAQVHTANEEGRTPTMDLVPLPAIRLVNLGGGDGGR